MTPRFSGHRLPRNRHRLRHPLVSHESSGGIVTTLTLVEAATAVRFDTPGDYILRAIAFDRLFEAWHDVAVTVTP